MRFAIAIRVCVHLPWANARIRVVNSSIYPYNMLRERGINNKLLSAEGELWQTKIEKFPKMRLRHGVL